MKLPSLKSQLIIFLTAFALFMYIRDRDSLFLSAIFISVIASVILDTIIFALRSKKILFTESSIITGLIIGYVISSEEQWWVFILAVLFAIGSKHIIKVRQKHLFNPAAFGVFLVIILFGVSTQWQGTYLWYILLPFGLYFAQRIRRLEIIIGYGLTALCLFGIQAVIQRAPLPNIFGYLSYFYIFIMLIEPKTTPLNSKAKLIFGIGAAILIFILTEAAVKFDAELCALLVLNLFVPVLNKIPERSPI